MTISAAPAPLTVPGMTLPALGVTVVPTDALAGVCARATLAGELAAAVLDFMQLGGRASVGVEHERDWARLVELLERVGAGNGTAAD